MRAIDIINKLISLGIYLFLHESRLKFKAPQGKMTDETIAMLRQRKQALISLLKTWNPYLPMVIKPSTVKPLVADLLFWAVRWMLMFLSDPNYRFQKTRISMRHPRVKKKFPTGAMTHLIRDDCNNALDKIPENSIDAIISDTPYGLGFMGKKWDKLISSVSTLRKCYRIMKHAAWIVLFSSPRQDLLSKMIANLEEAGFETGFTSIYWTYATGFPKSYNISNSLHKKGCERKAEKLEGAFAGFQPKPAVEVIIVGMKQLKEKTYTAQALSNGKGVTRLDDCRIPYADEVPSIGNRHQHNRGNGYGYKPQWKAKGGVQWSPEKQWKQDIERQAHEKGRVPANLLVSNDVLDDGKRYGSGSWTNYSNGPVFYEGDKSKYKEWKKVSEKPGTYSRFFSLDAWAQKNDPFLIVPKASTKEKESGCEELVPRQMDNTRYDPDAAGCNNPRNRGGKERKNNHPTAKPVELMRYLVTMFTRPGDTVLDPYMGTGTTCLAAQSLGRRSIGIEINAEYFEIAAAKHYANRINNYFADDFGLGDKRCEKNDLNKTKALEDFKTDKVVKPPATTANITHQLDEDLQLVNADFYTWCNDNIEPDSIDTILTDPPYPKKYLHLWDQLGEVAAKGLKEGGCLVTYSGLYHLPNVIEALNRHLTYCWMIALHHKGKTQLVFPSNVISTYKPILIFRKGEQRKFKKTIPDSITSDKRDKNYHKWGQGEKAVRQLMSTFSEDNDLVLDPFVGGGTTLAVAKQLGRRCIGIEIDKDLIDVIKKRLDKINAKV